MGVGLRPRASMERVLPYLDRLDLLLLLGVQPGFGGQRMLAGTLPWLSQIARLRDQEAPGLLIAIDGGVKGVNAASIVLAGADVLIVGTGLFANDDMPPLVESLKQLQR